jgi:hypothetical protein
MVDDAKKPKRPRMVLRAEAANVIVDLLSGKLKKGSPEELDALSAVAWCFQEAATVFVEIDKSLQPAGFRASVDPAIWRLLRDVADPNMGDFGGVRLAIERISRRGRPPKFDDRQIAEYVWHLVKRRGWQREPAYFKARDVFGTKHKSTAEKAFAKWEPIFIWAEEIMPASGKPRVRAMARMYATTPPDDADEIAPAPDEKKPDT